MTNNQRPAPAPPTFVYRSSSDNTDFYLAPGINGSYMMAEVLIDAMAKDSASGQWRARPVPHYWIILHVRPGSGGLSKRGRFAYMPRTRPKGGRLPNRTVTRLVRNYLTGR